MRNRQFRRVRHRLVVSVSHIPTLYDVNATTIGHSIYTTSIICDLSVGRVRVLHNALSCRVLYHGAVRRGRWPPQLAADVGGKCDNSAHPRTALQKGVQIMAKRALDVRHARVVVCALATEVDAQVELC